MKCESCLRYKQQNPLNPWIQQKKVYPVTRIFNGLFLCGYCARSKRESCIEYDFDYTEELI
jgi:hypothetical protein